MRSRDLFLEKESIVSVGNLCFLIISIENLCYRSGFSRESLFYLEVIIREGFFIVGVEREFETMSKVGKSWNG